MKENPLQPGFSRHNRNFDSLPGPGGFVSGRGHGDNTPPVPAVGFRRFAPLNATDEVSDLVFQAVVPGYLYGGSLLAVPGE